MNVQVVEATIWDEPTFRNLFQYYLYEFSRFMHWRVTYAGKFFEIDLEGCWTDDQRHPFLIKLDDELAGLAIVDERGESKLSGDTNIRELSEFFVLAAYRRHGVGTQAAHLIFSRFPGKWEVRQMARNVNAPTFWRKVIGDYTNGLYREVVFDDERWHGTAQFFDNSPSQPETDPNS